jgi:hypothetical protein
MAWILRLRRGDPGYRAGREQQLNVGSAFRDIDTVPTNTLNHPNDKMLTAGEVPEYRPTGVARSGLNGGLE